MDKTNCTESPGQTVAASPEGGTIRHVKTLADLAAEQGVGPITDFDALLVGQRRFSHWARLRWVGLWILGVAMGFPRS